MKRNKLPGIIVFIIMIALVSGTTFAWFTATANVPDNVFAAGTVNIQADRITTVGKTITENWNPGDCEELEYKIVNTGSKSTYIRTKILKQWLPKDLRVLVVYAGNTVQLLAVEWDSDMQDCILDEGAIANGTFYVGWPSYQSYIDGIFTNLSNTDFLENDSIYSVWCLDKWESISKNTNYEVQIFDPLCNPDWYLEVDSKWIWEEIPWEKIVYIVNGDFINRGYTSDEIQDAIWHFTNSFEVSGKALEIVDETNENWQLPSNNVTVTPGEGWIQGDDGYWYYEESIPGTYSVFNEEERTIVFNTKVCLDGDLTGNEYQGEMFLMNLEFEAIQSSNGAIDDAWPSNPITNALND